MFNNSKRKEERMHQQLADDSKIISAPIYNFVIGMMLLYGFVMNAVLTASAGNIVASINPIVFIIIYFVCGIIGSIIVKASHKPIFSFLGYNLIAVPIGAVLTLIIPEYPVQQIISAIVIVACVSAGMMVASMIFPHVFSKMGPALFFSLLFAILAEIIASLLGYRGDLFNWIAVVIFSLYIGYDWNKAQNYPKTIDNAIDSAVDLYLDIINLFIRILDLLDND